MYTTSFWKDTFERVLGTVAAVLIPILVASQSDLFSLDWKAAVSLAVSAAAVTILKSLVAANVGGTVSPASLAKE